MGSCTLQEQWQVRPGRVGEPPANLSTRCAALPGRILFPNLMGLPCKGRGRDVDAIVEGLVVGDVRVSRS